MRSLNTAPPHGWIVLPPLVAAGARYWTFGDARRAVQQHHPEFTQAEAEERVDRENALRCMHNGAHHFVVSDARPEWPEPDKALAGDAPVFVQLGRFGDLIILLPAFLELYVRSGLKPRVIVSWEYASVLDGVSYVESTALPVNWYSGMPEARRFAANLAGPAARVLQCHGHEWGVDIGRWPNYMASMWDRAGFTVDEMKDLPLIFDRRNREREAALVASCRGNDPRPMLLYNGTGVSSPCPKWPVMIGFLQQFAQLFNLIDLGAIKAERIYDLLGLMDVAAGMVTIDTSTGHLSVGSKMPTIWLLVDGWSGSTPRGNVEAGFRYSVMTDHLVEMEQIIKKWLAQSKAA